MRFGPYFAMLNGQFEHKDGEIVTEAYLDSGGIPTGPGGLIRNPDGSPVRMGQTWSEAEALQIYADAKSDWADAIWKLINPAIRSQLKQHQFDALGILSWNIGIGAFKRSTALRTLNEGRFEESAASFLLWRRDRLKGGKVGPDGKPARDPNGEVMPVGVSWFKAMRGIYRRSASAALLFMGHDWRNAASSQKIALNKVPTWREANNEWYDEVTHATPWEDILMDARSDPLPVIKGRFDTIEDDLFDEPTKMEIAQHESAKAAGYDGTIEEFTEHLQARPGKARISQMTRKLQEVPYGIDPDAGVKPMDEARRAKEFARAKSARDDQDVGRAATAAAAGLGVANTIVNETTTLLDSVTGYAIMFLVMLFVFGAAWWGYGRWREYDAEKKRLEAEIDARQVMY